MIRKKTRTGMMEYFYNNQLNQRSLRKLVDKAIAQETEYESDLDPPTEE